MGHDHDVNIKFDVFIQRLQTVLFIFYRVFYVFQPFFAFMVITVVNGLDML